LDKFKNAFEFIFRNIQNSLILKCVCQIKSKFIDLYARAYWGTRLAKDSIIDEDLES